MADTHPARSYMVGDRVTLGPPGQNHGTGTVTAFVRYTQVRIPGGYEHVFLVHVDGEPEPRPYGTGWMQPAPKVAE